jgi:hypothetical protein
MGRGHLSGIVDWECAGFYPEYWEFTKLVYGAERIPEIREIVRGRSQRKTMKRSWRLRCVYRMIRRLLYRIMRCQKQDKAV